MAKKAELRIYVDPKLDKKIRAIALITESNISAIASAALEQWLNNPENQELVQKHSLDDL